MKPDYMIHLPLLKFIGLAPKKEVLFALFQINNQTKEIQFIN